MRFILVRYAAGSIGMPDGRRDAGYDIGAAISWTNAWRLWATDTRIPWIVWTRGTSST